MLRRILGSSRYIVWFAIVGTFVASLALLVFEAMVIFRAVAHAIWQGSISSMAGKDLAVGLIEAIDVFLIAIVGYIISVGLYELFVDDTLPLPHWLQFHDLEDLKNHLVSVVIAVLAVLFLREAVARAEDLDLLSLGAALAIMIVALTLFLARRGAGGPDPAKD
jgi:uncharacterized membrane protein YqhA